MKSTFQVSWHGAIIGTATMVERRVEFKADPQSQLLTRKGKTWTKEFVSKTKKLCRSVGHYSKYSISTCLLSGVCVERL